MRPASGVEVRLLALAILVLAVGVALTLAGERLRPGLEGDPAFVVLRGPFEARYDPASASTVLVGACVYCERPVGALIAGDARDLAPARHVYLRQRGDDPAATSAVEPFALANGTTVRDFAGPYERADPAFRIGLLVVGLALCAIGAAWALEALGLASRGSALAGGAAGLALGWQAATMGEGGVIAILAAVPLLVLSLVLLAIPRTRRHAAAPLVAMMLSLAGLGLLHAYYPRLPAI